ncbi:MAG TPA: hypothetical protein VHE37_15985 [Nevskiaceae bacterium]|nr:hypothetical protein [Nevskiaceae bacterium]
MRTLAMGFTAALLLASGCATNARCKGVQDYQKAETMPAAQPVPDLKVQDNASSLKIPPAPAKSVAYGEQVPDPAKPGKTRLECLDTPPAMPPETTPAPAATPAPARKP